LIIKIVFKDDELDNLYVMISVVDF